MRILAGLGVVAALALGAGALWFFEPWESEDERTVDVAEIEAAGEEFRGSACRRVAGLAARLAEADPPPLEFLRDFGRQVAGIRPPPRAYGDLASGGRNRVAGRGFLARFDDGTVGQARHFAGIAVAATFGGSQATRWVSIFVRDDPLDSPDGRLTEEGIEFAQEVLSGELAVAEAPRWLLDRLCRRK